MKVAQANLLSNVVNVYDQTKTTIQGRVFSKTLNGNTVLGPPLNTFVDTVADTAGQVSPVLSYMSPNGRLFSVTSETSGRAFISCHEVDLNTGNKTFVGTIRIGVGEIATTTHTLRGLKVLDSGTTGWRIFFATSASVVINGGLLCINNVDKADFIPVGFTDFPFATGSNQKATYLLQDPSGLGVNHLNVAAQGLTMDVANNRIYCHNGTAAAHQFFVYSMNATLNCALTSGLAIDDVADTVVHAGHSFQNNDPVFITNLVGGAGLTTNTNYFIRNVTGGTYQLSATTGGAAINITSAGTLSICRAFGATGDAFVHKTGNLPALAGTLIGADSEDYAVPGHTSNAGQPCIFFCSTTTVYLGRISELTSGATAWPSLISANILGAVNQITTPTIIQATWSNALDKLIYLTNANILVMKPFVNNQIDYIFGGTNNKYREGTVANEIELGLLTITALDVENGWLIVTGGTTGQRGNILCDLRSDALFDYSYIVTKVMDTPSAVYKFITTIDELYDFTGSLEIEYRTSGFGSISGGWTAMPFAQDLSAFSAGDKVQFKIRFATLGLDTCIPAQLMEFFIAYESLGEISENWEFSRDKSDNSTPSRVAFRLKNAYATSVPTLYFRAYDLTNSLLINNNSSANAANFQYSTDNGVTWLPLGTIPNTVGTLIRYTFTTPPGVDIRPGLKES